MYTSIYFSDIQLSRTVQSDQVNLSQVQGLCKRIINYLNNPLQANLAIVNDIFFFKKLKKKNHFGQIWRNSNNFSKKKWVPLDFLYQKQAYLTISKIPKTLDEQISLKDGDRQTVRQASQKKPISYVESFCAAQRSN